MGAQACGLGYGSDSLPSVLRQSEIEGLRNTLDLKHFNQHHHYGFSGIAPSSAGEALPEDGEVDSPAACSAGRLTTRGGYPSSAMLETLYEVQPPTMQDLPDYRVAVHRTTGKVQRLISVLKPGGVELQERLRGAVRRIHGLRSDGVARVLEVFEDARSISLIAEHCNGGTVYDRILQRQYFAEQESAVLVRHILQSLAGLHSAGLAHGFPTPDSFRFQSEEAHAPLKLVDYGLDLKVALLDTSSSSPGGRRRTSCLQLWETCRLVFCAPEVVRSPQHEARGGQDDGAGVGGLGAGDDAGGASYLQQLNADLLAEAIDAHLEQSEDTEERLRMLEAADTWGAGAIAFLLLCGYPPFFAPCRDPILGRIGKTDFSFDPPFWSKISEEAKDFVQLCLRTSPERRPTVLEALQHPWIHNLADNSPGGSMLSSFALNLRRFYRTSLIETYAANSLAAKLTVAEARSFLARCVETDLNDNGFLTATDLRQVLIATGHGDIAESVAACFARLLRHPGESYIDYRSLMESTQLRRERLVEEELWQCFLAFKGAPPSAAGVASQAPVSPTGGAARGGRLPAAKVGEFLQAADVRRLLSRSGLEASFSPGAGADLAPFLLRRLGPGVSEVDFIDVACEVLRGLPSMAQEAPLPAAQTPARPPPPSNAPGRAAPGPPQPRHSPQQLAGGLGAGA